MKSWVYLVTGVLLFLIIAWLTGGFLKISLWILICGLWLAFGRKSAELSSLTDAQEKSDHNDQVEFGWLEAGTGFLSEDLRAKIRQALSSAYLFVDSKIDQLTANVKIYLDQRATGKADESVISANDSVPFSKSNHPSTMRPLLYGIVGFMIGIPASYWVQSGALRGKLSLGRYLEYVWNTLIDIGDIDRVFRGNKGEIFITLLVTCGVLACVGVVVGIRQNRKS